MRTFCKYAAIALVITIGLTFLGYFTGYWLAGTIAWSHSAQAGLLIKLGMPLWLNDILLNFTLWGTLVLIITMVVAEHRDVI